MTNGDAAQHHRQWPPYSPRATSSKATVRAPLTADFCTAWKPSRGTGPSHRSSEAAALTPHLGEAKVPRPRRKGGCGQADNGSKSLEAPLPHPEGGLTVAAAEVVVAPGTVR